VIFNSCTLVEMMKTAVLLLVSAAGAWAASAGQEVYDKSCKSCHGAQGQGNPAIAKMMKVTMLHLGSKEVQAKSDADLKEAITKGTGKMKPMPALSAKQLSEVVAFVRTLKQ
jgi:mono/diheme cytochrome c family protein